MSRRGTDGKRIRIRNQLLSAYACAGEPLECHFCSVPLVMIGTQRKQPNNGLTVEHYKPLLEGGVNSASNCVLACARCNYKRDRDSQRKRQRRINELIEILIPKFDRRY